MEMKDILSKLCYYDKRNPDCIMTDEEIKERNEIDNKNNNSSCSCDNCFYGRTKMAEYILSLFNQIYYFKKAVEAQEKRCVRLRNIISNNSDYKYTIEDIKKSIELAREGNIGYYAPNAPMFYYDKTYNEIVESFLNNNNNNNK